MKFGLLVAALVPALLAGCNTAAPDAAADLPAGLHVEAPWVRATVAGSTVSAGYFTIRNGNATPDALLDVASPVAGRTELHRTVTEDGMARMRPAGDVQIGSGQTVQAEPGGLHVMLMELHQPLAPGATVPLSLVFRDAGTMVVEAEVRGVPGMTGDSGDPAHHDHAYASGYAPVRDHDHHDHHDHDHDHDDL